LGATQAAKLLADFLGSAFCFLKKSLGDLF
jgi:hypothetical protein